jgi:hypothetical protein
MHRGAAAAAAGSADTRVSFKAAGNVSFKAAGSFNHPCWLQEPRSKGRGGQVVLSSSPEQEEVSFEAHMLILSSSSHSQTCLAEC